MTTQPQRMDTSLAPLKDAIEAIRQNFQTDTQNHPQDALRTSGDVLTEINGNIMRLLSELIRDVERLIGKSGSATQENTGLSKGNIKAIQKAHGQTTDAQYQQAKKQAAIDGKALTRESVMMANPSAKPKRKRANKAQQLQLQLAQSQNDKQQLQSQVDQLQNNNKQLQSRVLKLENTLDEHQIPLPL